jgi:hypothetical protein
MYDDQQSLKDKREIFEILYIVHYGNCQQSQKNFVTTKLAASKVSVNNNESYGMDVFFLKRVSNINSIIFQFECKNASTLQ